MEWHRAKNILILLFLAVNIFLLCILVNANTKADFDRQKLQKVLTANNIKVDLDILPHQKNRIFVSEFYGVTDSIIHFFIPKVTKIDGTAYSDETKTIIVEGNKISYTNSSPSDPSFRNTVKSNVLSKLKPVLKQLGIEKYVSNGSVTESDGMYLIEFKYIIDKREIFNSELAFLVSNRGIIKCEGTIYVPDEKNGYSYEINLAETILLQLERSEKTLFDITSIKLGLYISDYENAVITQAIPAYEIKTDNRTYIYDARIGVDSQNRKLGELMK